LIFKNHCCLEIWIRVTKISFFQTNVTLIWRSPRVWLLKIIFLNEMLFSVWTTIYLKVRGCHRNYRGFLFVQHTKQAVISKISNFCLLLPWVAMLYTNFCVRVIRTWMDRFRSSLICQGTSTRRQQSDHFDLRIKLPPVTTILTTQR